MPDLKPMLSRQRRHTYGSREIGRLAAGKLRLKDDYDRVRVMRIIVFHRLRESAVLFAVGIVLIVGGVVTLMAFMDIDHDGRLRFPALFLVAVLTLIGGGFSLLFAILGVLRAWYTLDSTDPIDRFYDPKSWRRIEVKDFDGDHGANKPQITDDPKGAA